MRRIRRLFRTEGGYAAVEFTLLLPLFLALVFSVVEMGSAWYARQVMVNASREGARFGVLFNQDGLSNQQVEDHVQAVLDQAGFAMPVEVSATGADGLPGTMVTVVVTAQYQLNVLGALIPGLGNDDDNPGGVTLSATTVMRHE